MVKAENFYVNQITGEKQHPGITLSGLQDAFSGIRDHFMTTRRTFGKRIINLSMGSYMPS